MNIGSQVADVTRPLACPNDMVDTDHICLLTKTGGAVKHLSTEDLNKIMEIINKAPGAMVPIIRNGRSHVIQIVVPKEGKWETPKRPAKRVTVGKTETIPISNRWQNAQEDEMEVDQTFTWQEHLP